MEQVFLPEPFGGRSTTTKCLRVLLVLPIREGNFQVTPDRGILHLGTVLRNAGFSVALLDCPKEQFSFQDFKTFVQEGNFDVVGFRCCSRDHNYVNHHASIVKGLNPGILTLVGGPHPSALPEFVLSSMPKVDFAWKAEAEEGLPQLLSLFREYRLDIPEQLLKTIPGLVWHSKKEERAIL